LPCGEDRCRESERGSDFSAKAPVPAPKNQEEIHGVHTDDERAARYGGSTPGDERADDRGVTPDDRTIGHLLRDLAPQVARRHGDFDPTVSLNNAIASAMVNGPAAGLALLDTLDKDSRIAGHYRLAAVRGHLLEKAGDRPGAIAHFRAAAERTASIPERDYLLLKAARLAG
jgi:hypothetical protein